ncbi:type II toxin-antitoxin system VapC family toxin [Agromyces silvae]|uniref:type II toxin-antitoxin system VapC family toxin n=1 Tax=Agromyces silvae TaxID=3388266 RepID=UPI00280B2AB4|nr:type II toxin-antitoxin system VapC family toxin [Agromyces protaetiae]
MIFLLDTQLLLWAALDDPRLSREARRLIGDRAHELTFSAASVWEVGIKAAKGRADYQISPRVFRRSLLENGYDELAISGLHGIEAGALPSVHRDPFDRMLIAQARVEGIPLLTADERLAAYGEPVIVV